jgi:hypothetical protein
MSSPEPSDVESALDRNVDPVSEPEAYRQMLLGLLGDRDPAEVQAEFPAQLRATVAEAGPDLRTKPAPGEWSALEVLGHFVDAEIASGARYRWILAHDEPPLIGYDQDLWVERLHHQDGDPEEMLSLLEALRKSHLRLWARSSESDRAQDRRALRARARELRAHIPTGRRPRPLPSRPDAAHPCPGGRAMRAAGPQRGHRPRHAGVDAPGGPAGRFS